VKRQGGRDEEQARRVALEGDLREVAVVLELAGLSCRRTRPSAKPEHYFEAAAPVGVEADALDFDLRREVTE
jgi:hypothetical protein